MSRDPRATEALSPVKQALAEIRRLKRELARATSGIAEPVAVVGMGIRLPVVGSEPDRLHGYFCDGVDGIREVPADRWDVDAFYDPDPETPGTMYTRKGGFLDDVRGFDPEFFGISPFEAATIDPQHRLLLEVTWEALEHAAIAPDSLRGSRTGVFLGISGIDYCRMAFADPRDVDAYAGVGTTLSVAAGRISYALDLRGPAVAIDTACSSSLVATCMAQRSLASGESDLAVVGGINLMLSPEVTINFCKAGMLSPEGRCKAFDDEADGYVRSEGCIVVVLKRLADAQRDGDRTLAVIRGGAVNQDGRSSGITAPNGPSQEAVIRAALANAGADADQIGYVEAHGTGTSLGDPIELNALGAVFGDRSLDDPLWVGSAKTNFGHLEAAAGLLGLVKAVEALRHGELHPHINFVTPNAHVAWSELPIAIPTKRTPFAPRDGKRLAGVSSFGFSGTNVHLVLEEAPSPMPRRASEPVGNEALVLPISADREEALRELAARYVDLLAETTDSLADICYTAGIGRAHLSQRIAVVANSKNEAREALQAWLDDGRHERLVSSDDGGAIDVESARRYAAGERIDWSAEHAGRHRRRVSLPTYAFQRRPYWLPEREGATAENGGSPATEPLPPFDAALVAADERAALAPLDMNIASYAEKWSLLATLTAALGHNLLLSRGAFADDTSRDIDAILSQCDIKPIYRPIVERWLDAMAASGAVARSADGWRAEVVPAPIDDGPIWERVDEALQDNKPMLRYIRNCTNHLEGVLTGSVSPLETLFPQGSFDLAIELYEQSTQIRYINGIAAAVLDAWVRRRLPRGGVRVLEIGAGTGGTTSSLLPVLPAARTTYDYTDLTDIFLELSRERFPEASFLRTRHFDMEQEIEEQGLEPGCYDVIIAANVVHAARDLRAALRRIRSLLAPGGLLLMVESTGHLDWHDITTGLIEGWQHFEDDLRSDTPLLPVEAWRSVLDEEGFVAVGAAPSADSPAAVLAQHVIFAVAPGQSLEPRDRVGGAAVAGAASPTASSADTRAAAVATPAANHDSFLSRMSAAVASEREQITANAVRASVVDVLRSDPQRPPSVDARLMELGLDSLMAVRLRNTLEERLELPFSLPSTLMFDYPTVRHIAGLILERLEDVEAAGGAPPVGDAAAEAASPDDAPRNEQREAEIAELSDEEVEALLVDRLEAGEGR